MVHASADKGPDLVRARLFQRYGPPPESRRLPPLDELILTILSQNTNDRNRDRAYQALHSRFEDWKQVLETPVVELARIIAPAGLGPTKADRIHGLLKRVYEGPDPAFLDLCALSPEEARGRLLSIKGVGPKTAACVLLFSCDIPALPVDTHIYRVSRRLGLLHGGTDRARAHEVLGELFPARHYLEIHLNMIRLGREVCRASRPRCSRCPLTDLCPTAGPARPAAKGGYRDA